MNICGLPATPEYEGSAGLGLVAGLPSSVFTSMAQTNCTHGEPGVWQRIHIPRSPRANVLRRRARTRLCVLLPHQTGALILSLRPQSSHSHPPPPLPFAVPMPTGFSIGRKTQALPAWPVREACNYLADPALADNADPAPLLRAMGRALNLNFNPTSPESCLDLSVRRCCPVGWGLWWTRRAACTDLVSGRAPRDGKPFPPPSPGIRRNRGPALGLPRLRGAPVPRQQRQRHYQHVHAPGEPAWG